MWKRKQSGEMSLMVLGVIVAIVIGLAVVAGVFRWLDKNEKARIDDGKTIATQVVTIATQKDTIEKGGQSTAVTEKTNVNIAVKKEETGKRIDKVVKKTSEEIAVIEQNLSVTKFSIETEEAAAKAISSATIAGLWAAYCEAGGKDCTSPVKPGDKSTVKT